MKKFVFVAVVLFAGFSIAEDLPLDLSTPVETKKTKPVKSERPQPCAVIERACKAANYTKFLHRDCVAPLLKGRDVPGVTTGDISLQQIKACRMYKEDNLRR